LWADLQKADDVQQWCYDSVAEQWKRSAYSWPLRGSSRSRDGLTALSKPPSDDERLARWLRSSVAPAVERLRRSMPPEQIARLLGLPMPPDDAAEHSDDAR
jgi:hypothetical protein